MLIQARNFVVEIDRAVYAAREKGIFTRPIRGPGYDEAFGVRIILRCVGSPPLEINYRDERDADADWETLTKAFRNPWRNP